jgi:hypothetical protein
MITSRIFGYTGNGYLAADSIYPCHAYWIKVSQAGQLILSTSFPSIAGRLKESVLPYGNRIKITDASGKIQQLYLMEQNEISSPDAFELPPLPPNGVFDVRFSSGRNLEAMQKDITSEFPIMISGAHYPLNISWETLPDCKKLFLKVGDKIVSIDGKGDVTIASRTALTLVEQKEATLPNEFILAQNYPNPFNPTTKIHFEVPVNAHVSLKVMDVLGRDVATLVEEEKVAGSYDYDFNAANLSSGMYFYRLSAGDILMIKKMVIMK